MIGLPILIGIGAASAGARPFFQKKVLEKMSSLEFISLEIILFFIIAIIVLWKSETFKKVRALDSKTWFFFFGGIVLSITSMLIYFYLIKKQRTTLVISIYMPLTLIFTVLLGWIFFNEKINSIEILGILVIIIGIVLMNIKRATPPKPTFAQSLGMPII